jgi:hypothetical protein
VRARHATAHSSLWESKAQAAESKLGCACTGVVRADRRRRRGAAPRQLRVRGRFGCSLRVAKKHVTHGRSIFGSGHLVSVRERRVTNGVRKPGADLSRVRRTCVERHSARSVCVAVWLAGQLFITAAPSPAGSAVLIQDVCRRNPPAVQVQGELHANVRLQRPRAAGAQSVSAPEPATRQR